METDATLAEPKMYRPLPTVLITLAIFFGSQILGGILLSILLLALSGSAAQVDTLLETPWVQFAFIVIVEALTLRLLWEFMRRRHITFGDLGITKPELNHVGYALVGFAVYFILYLIVLTVITSVIPGFNAEQEQQLGFNKSASGVELIPIFISLVILPPLVEEIVARGFLFRGLRTTLSFMKAALLTSLLFAAAHLPESSEGLLWVAAVDTFILSMVMCHLREKTGSLWAPIGVHFIKNGLAFFVLFNIVQYFR